MIRRALSIALATVFLGVAITHPAVAEDKKLTPQQQKMKDCAAKWKAEKAKTNVKGRDAYKKFMSACLKEKG